MILDDLLKLRSGGSAPLVTATENGPTSLTRDGTTGKVVVQINKMPADGLPVIVLAAADAGTSTDKSLAVTIEASDTLASGYVQVASFTAQTYADKTAKKMVRKIATQMKYLRSVITAAGSNGTISRDYKIYLGIGEVDEG